MFRKSMWLAGVSMVLVPGAALAQDSSGAEPVPTAADIVVTGSRVITNGNNSPTPVTVVTTEQRDCQDFRVWPGIMGNKESHYVTTQRTCHTE